MCKETVTVLRLVANIELSSELATSQCNKAQRANGGSAADPRTECSQRQDSAESVLELATHRPVTAEPRNADSVFGDFYTGYRSTVLYLIQFFVRVYNHSVLNRLMCCMHGKWKISNHDLIRQNAEATQDKSQD